LQTHRPIELLPDRLATTIAQWLRDHPGVEIIARDRSGAVAEGASAGAPQALQVADRFELLKNMSEVLLRTFQQYRGEIEELLAASRSSAGALAPLGPAEPTGDRPTVQPETVLPPQPTPPRVGQKQQQCQRRRQERYQTIQHLYQQGWTMVAIADQLGITRKTVRRYLDMPHGPAPQRHSHRRSILDPYKPYLLERWNAGCYTAMQLFREVQGQGFRGTDGTVRRYLTQVRKACGLLPYSRNAADQSTSDALGGTLPSLTSLCWWVLRKEESREDDEEQSVEQLRHGHAELDSAITLAREFASMVRKRQVEQFDSWLERASSSGLAAFRSFATGLRQDEAAVRAALSLPYSNGPTEGNINRLKCLKRQMYGRAKLDLLRQRLLAA
jgi:transposase